MFIKSAQCGNCGERIRILPRLLSFKLAPYQIVCSRCQSRVKLGFSLRVTWLSWLVWKAAAIVLWPAFIIITMLKPRSVAEIVLISLVGLVILVIPVSYIISLILPIFLQPIIDLIHSCCNKPVGQEESEKNVADCDEQS